MARQPALSFDEALGRIGEEIEQRLLQVDGSATPTRVYIINTTRRLPPTGPTRPPAPLAAISGESRRRNSRPARPCRAPRVISTAKPLHSPSVAPQFSTSGRLRAWA